MWVEVGHTTQMNAVVFFSSMFVVVCQAEPFHADCDARAIVWSILPCLARYGPDARSLEACLGLRLGCLLIAYATTVIPSHKSVGVKNIPEMQIVSEPNKIFQNRIKLSQNRKYSKTNKNIFFKKISSKYNQVWSSFEDLVVRNITV